MKKKVFAGALAIMSVAALSFAPASSTIGVGHALVRTLTGTTVAEAASNSLAGLPHLDNVVKIYVPNTIHEDKPIDPKLRQKYVDQTLTKLSNLFGGATSIDGVGAWVDDKKHELVKEKVTIVYSNSDTLSDKLINQFVAYARLLKKEMDQSSITIEVNGKMYFI